MKEQIEKLKTSPVHRRFWSVLKTMLSYCLNCRLNAESKNRKVENINRGKLVLLSSCSVCDFENWKFISSKNLSDY